MAPGEDGHVSCSNRMFLHRNKSLSARMEMVENVENDPEEAERRALHTLEVQHQSLIYKSGPGYVVAIPAKTTCSARLCRKEPSIFEKGLTWNCFLGNIYCSTSCHISS